MSKLWITNVFSHYLTGYALCHQGLTIAHCFTIAVFLHICKRILDFLVPKLVIWPAWCLHFGVLGNPGTILGYVEHKKGHF